MRMTPELMYLLWSVALTVVLVVVATLGATQQVGLPKLAGNRDNMPEMQGWAGRAERAHRNMLAELPASELREDGIHYTPKGYALLAQRVLPLIIDALNKR